MQNIILCLLLLLGGCSVKNPSIGYSHAFHLHIIHVNDTHSHLEPTSLNVKIQEKKECIKVGGYAALRSYIKNHKSDQTLFLHAGDALQGTLFYTIFKGRADIEVLNRLGIDAFVLGNHEFDEGTNTLYKNFISKATFPIVSANVTFLDKEVAKRVEPYIIKRFVEEEIAIVGLTVDSSNISKPGKKVIFEDYLRVAQDVVKKLKKKNINKIIFLTHLGIKKDKKLAQALPEIDLIVGGHSHTLLGDWKGVGLDSYGPYPLVVEHNDSKTLIVSAWKWARVVGDIDLWFDKKGHIVHYHSHPKIISTTKKFSPWIERVKSDPKIVDLIERYKPPIEALRKRVIASVKEDLYHVRLPEEKNSEGQVMRNGSLVAPHICRSMWEYLNEKGMRVDFALQNSGGVRISLYKGSLELDKVYNLLPFGNTLVVVKMKGTKIENMFKSVVEYAFKKGRSGAFPYLWNARIVLNKSKDFIEVEIREGNKWLKIKPDREYTFVTNSFVAKGGAFYKAIKDAEKYDTGYLDTEAFIEYVKKVKELKTLSPTIRYINGALR